MVTPEEAARAAYSPAQRWISNAISLTVTLLLAAMTLLPVQGSQHYDPSKRPQLGLFQAFDTVFRAAGALLPIVPWILRAVGHSRLPVRVQELPAICHPMPELLLLLATQAIRVCFHFVHTSGQRVHCALSRKGACDPHAPHVFADHVLLGVAVQAFAAVELAAALHTGHRLLVQRKFASREVPTAALVPVVAAAFSAAALLALTTGETINTALYFHPQREIVAALALGAPLFVAPAVGYLYSWSNLRDP